MGWGGSVSAECLGAAVEVAYARGTPTGKERGQGKAAVVAEAEVPRRVGGSGFRDPSQDSCGAAVYTLAMLTQFLSSEQPAIHNLALQAGGVCLQPVPEQREPQPGGHRHAHHHEPESHRSVACEDLHDVVRRAELCPDCCPKAMHPRDA